MVYGESAFDRRRIEVQRGEALEARALQLGARASRAYRHAKYAAEVALASVAELIVEAHTHFIDISTPVTVVGGAAILSAAFEATRGFLCNELAADKQQELEELFPNGSLHPGAGLFGSGGQRN